MAERREGFGGLEVSGVVDRGFGAQRAVLFEDASIVVKTDSRATENVMNGAAAPLVKPTLRGILPHGSEAPWVPIPLRSEELDDSPCLGDDGCGICRRQIPRSTGGGDRLLATTAPDDLRHECEVRSTLVLATFQQPEQASRQMALEAT